MKASTSVTWWSGRTFGSRAGRCSTAAAPCGAVPCPATVNRGEQLGDRKGIAQGGNVSGHRAVAKAHQDSTASSDLLKQLKVFHVGDRTFDQDDIHPLRILLCVHQRPIYQLDFPVQLQQPFVQVEKAHVATGATSQPDGGHARPASLISLCVH